jgi:DNA-binding CsgD family transcriptional regulator/tetratricopeptide (TPR) repeat protein
MLTPALVCPELIGRSEALEALAERQRAAARGHGALVLVSGDAGIGKTRLVRAFRETLTNGRAAVGAGAYGEFANLPYAGIAEALRALGSHAPLETEASRAEQFASIAKRIEEMCGRRNVVIVLEDIHWADDASLAFLLHLARAIAKLRLLVVATYRSDELHRNHAAAPYIARLAREAVTQRLTLDPLARADMQRFVRATLEGHPRLPRTEIEEIVERSEGNPFFAEELLKNVYEHRGAAGATLPLTIRAAVTERVMLLDSDARTILSLAAIVGRRFEAAFIAEIAERSTADVLAVLRTARELQLVDEFSTDPPTFAFRHALSREAIYADMLVSEVRPLHGRIVAALEHAGSDESIADLGYHAWAARDAQRCVRYNELAGDQAEALHAYSDALRSYERALEGADDDATRGRLLAKAGASSSQDGNPDAAVRLYQAAADAYERAGERDRLTQLYHQMAGEAHAAGDSERAMTILRRGMRALDGATTASSHAWLAVTLGFLHLDRGEIATAQSLIDTSAAAAGDPSAAPIYYNTLLYAAALAGDLRAIERCSQQYLAACEGLEPERTIRAYYNIGFAWCALGHDERARALFELALPEIHARRLSSMEGIARAMLALLDARGGRLNAAREHVEAALAIPETATMQRVAVGAAALVTGRPLSDDDLIARAISSNTAESALATGINSTIGRYAGPYARWLNDRGRADEAVVILREAMEAIRSPYGATDTLLAAIELGDASTRRGALAFADILDRLPDVALYAATAAHMRALDARRSSAVATVFAQDAAQKYAAIGWHYYAAACTELTGDFAAAATAFRAMGAVADVRRLELGAVDAGRAPDRFGLSTREWEIARLIAAGASNKVLAERLFISQKTVEKHLTTIYAKLGFHNRSELAAFVARRSG